MKDLSSWTLLIIAAFGIWNAYQHASLRGKPGYWRGWSATGQSCLSGGCIGMASLLALNPEQGTLLTWGIGIVSIASFGLSLRLEQRAKREATQPGAAADAASPRR